MNQIILALFEGSLLTEAGVPVPDVFDYVKTAYQDSDEVQALFQDLKDDWRNPDAFMKMVQPFEKLKLKDPEMIVAYAFTQLASGTGMVDAFWRQCAYAYSLIRKVKMRRPTKEDIELARQLLAAFSPDHEIRSYFASLSNSPNWRQIETKTDDFPDLEKWAQSQTPGSYQAPFRCQKEVEVNCKLIEAPELALKIVNKWNQFLSTI